MADRTNRRRSDSVPAQVLTTTQRQPPLRRLIWAAIVVAAGGIYLTVWSITRPPEIQEVVRVVAPPPDRNATQDPVPPQPQVPRAESPDEGVSLPEEKKPPLDPGVLKRVQAKRDLQGGLKALRAGRLDEAQAKLHAALAGGADQSETMIALAKLAFERGRFDEAIDLGLRAVKAGGGTRARTIVANSHFKRRNYPGAILEYETILKKEPDNAEVKRYLAAARKKLGK